MKREFVVDSCSFKLFYADLISSKDSVHRRAVEKILDQDMILVDDKGAIIEEWARTCCGQRDEFFRTGIMNRLVEKTIRERTSSTGADLIRTLRNLGMPKADHKYIKLAISNKARAVISDDIDFYNPAVKKSTSTHITKIKQKSNGPICKFLKRDHGIIILILANVEGVFF